jgi:hypothetical protein
MNRGHGFHQFWSGHPRVGSLFGRGALLDPGNEKRLNIIHPALPVIYLLYTAIIVIYYDYYCSFLLVGFGLYNFVGFGLYNFIDKSLNVNKYYHIQNTRSTLV